MDAVDFSKRQWLVIAAGALTVAAASVLLVEASVALISCLLGWTMLAIAVSDARELIIPDVLSLPAIPAGLIATRFLAFGDSPGAVVLEHALAAASGAGALYAIRQLYGYWRRRVGLGLGDVKLAAVAGAWNGLEGLSLTLLLACVLAIGYVVLSNLRDLRSIESTAAVPFGVFFGPAIWIVWYAGAAGMRSLQDIAAVL
jgi:leader peptidase (prepilin peptidase)/N-methyltransferase